MKIYPAIIVEDNPADMDVIEKYISARVELSIVGKAVNGGDALKLLMKHRANLIFLDIDMPGMSGYDLLNRCNCKTNSHVIITTAYPFYAAEAFDREAIDFLIKPITYNRFNRAIDRYLEKIRNPDAESKIKKAAISIEGKGYSHHLMTDDIIYISSHGKKTVIHCKKNDIAVLLLMGEVQKIIPGKKFLQIHRQYVVNIKYIISLNGDFTGNHRITLNDDDDTELPAGRSYLKSIRKIFSSSGI
jgi:DNA-binding LytR/AlgR family response regulator